MGEFGKSEFQTKADKHCTSDSVEPARGGIEPLLHGAQALAGPGRGHRPAQVDPKAVEVEQQSQQQEGQGLVPCLRRNELRQERQEEQRHLGIEGIGPEPLQEHTFQAFFAISQREQVIFSYQNRTFGLAEGRNSGCAARPAHASGAEIRGKVGFGLGRDAAGSTGLAERAVVPLSTRSSKARK